MSSTASTSSLPSGLTVLKTFPDAFFIPEIIFGGLVWILVASSGIPVPMLQGWVMFVSVFCFIMSSVLLLLYFCGARGGRGCWIILDVVCQEIAAVFYLSAAVLEAYLTYIIKSPTSRYRENVAAVVFSFVTTFFYVIHNAGSLLRWKSS